MSYSDETNNFHPNDNKYFNLVHENDFVGLHLTVIHKIRVSMNVLDNCCATNAQIPNPAYAMAIPSTAEKIVPPIVEKKNLLNNIFLDTYAC